MIYYNQYNYPNTLYSATPPHTETIASSGCGICSMAMIVENLTGKKQDVALLGKEAIFKGWRVDGAGTDMTRMAPAIATMHKLTYSHTTNIDKAVECVKRGGMVIVNVSGGANGLFSDDGHFICLVGIAPDGRLMILDPGYYSGKFNKAVRKGKVEVKGDVCYVSKANLAADVRYTWSAYYLFNKEDDIDMEELKRLQEQVAALTEAVEKLANPMVYNYIDKNMPEWAHEAIQWVMDKGVLKGNENGLNLTDQDLRYFTWLYRLMR